MSADNIVYLKKQKKKFIVWEQSASIPANPEGSSLKEFKDKKDAMVYACELQEDTEYGISILSKN